MKHEFADAAELPNTTLIHDVPMVNCKGLFLRVFVNNEVFVVSTSPTGKPPIAVPAHSLCAGFQKGSWWNATKNNESTNADVDIPFVFTDANDVLFLEKRRMTLAEAIQARSENQPEKAQLRYHTLTAMPVEGDPGHFSVTLTHPLYWRMAKFNAHEEAQHEEKAEDDAPLQGTQGKHVSQHHMANAIPWHKWNKDIVSVMWTVRWASAGLTGVRPSLVFKEGFLIPSQKALQITS